MFLSDAPRQFRKDQANGECVLGHWVFRWKLYSTRCVSEGMKARWIAAATLLLATAVYADDGLTVFVNEIGRDKATSSTFGVAGAPATTRTVSEWTAGFGVAFSHSWNARWSAEGSLGFEQHYMNGLRFVASLPVTSREKVRT